MQLENISEGVGLVLDDGDGTPSCVEDVGQHKCRLDGVERHLGSGVSGREEGNRQPSPCKLTSTPASEMIRITIFCLLPPLLPNISGSIRVAYFAD